jgi:hypothetical protein
MPLPFAQLFIGFGITFATQRNPVLLFNRLLGSSGKQRWEEQTGRLR